MRRRLIFTHISWRHKPKLLHPYHATAPHASHSLSCDSITATHSSATDSR